ncbi:hypothetical protein Tco_0741374 [Tanacetum coccineum]
MHKTLGHVLAVVLVDDAAPIRSFYSLIFSSDITKSLKIVMENPNHLNDPNEAIPEVNPIVPEPNQVVDIQDPNEMVDILGDIDLVDYDEEDPEEDPEEEPEEDVDIEFEDDAELIFSYERTRRSMLYFPRGLFEVGELSSARDSSHVDGLAPWALRHDLEASRAQARVMEAELGTCQTEFALLKSKNKIGEKTRELLNHDLENVERALGNVLERMSILESGENATLKKILAETETKLVLARMECKTAERRLHESQVWNKMFYLDMVRIGAVPKPPSDDEDTEHPRKKSKNSTSDGTEGPSEPRRPPISTQLQSYGFHFDKIPMYCDSKATIAISCNPVQHSRTKHIDVRYHFIKEQVEKGIVELFFVGTEYQLADLFTKALSEDRFKYLVRRLGMRCLTPDELEVLAIESA